MNNLEQELDQLNNRVTKVVSNWRTGNDLEGLKDFIQLIWCIEELINLYYDSIKNNSPDILAEFTLLLQELYIFLHNKDVIAMTDLLEYKMIPFIQQIKKGVRKDEI